MMDLFLVPNNPLNTVLVSPNGVAHYQIRTNKIPGSRRRVTVIQRPAETEEDSIVAEIEWKRWDMPTIIRSPLMIGLGICSGKEAEGLGTRSSNFLYQRGHFSSYV